MRKIYWKFICAKQLKKRLGLTFIECWKISESALENINGDLSECPVYSADEEYYAWCDAAK